jgi:alkylation response protein AidB-like acyl-CoA dehydrogenase
MTDELEMLRTTARRFFEDEVAPHAERFRKQHHIDRELWSKAGELGLLCMSVPEEVRRAGRDVCARGRRDGRAGPDLRHHLRFHSRRGQRTGVLSRHREPRAAAALDARHRVGSKMLSVCITEPMPAPT